MRILVVEDERLLCDGIAEDLELENPMIRCRYLYSLLLLEKIP